MSQTGPYHAEARYGMMRSAGLHQQSKSFHLFGRHKGVSCLSQRSLLCQRGSGLSRRRSPKIELIVALALPRLSVPDASALNSVGESRHCHLQPKLQKAHIS